MKTKELINSVNIFGVNVVFDDMDKVRESISHGEHIIYFSPVEGREREKFNRMYRKEKFKSTSACIHFPDLSISEIINIYKCWDGSGMYDFTCNTIRERCKNIECIDEAFIIFLFLHEVGHWKQFNELECNVKAFWEMDIEFEKDNLDKMIKLEKQRDERLSKGNVCLLTVRERKLAEQYMIEYRSIPKEKEADEFALEKIGDSLSLLYSTRQVDGV